MRYHAAMKSGLAFAAALGVCGAFAWAQAPVPPAAGTPLKGLRYDAEFFPGADHDPKVPSPDAVLGFRLGDKPATHGQVEAVIKSIAEGNPRCRLFEYAVSHEGRALHYVVIGSEANIRRLDEIKAGAAALADPRTGGRVPGDMPAIAWMAYCIHGDEMSGTDAALAVAHHLAAGRDRATTALLERVLVIIDPLMNPDGRDRCITEQRESRTVQPAVDDQSMIHAQSWPSGRMNHYLFDMNRDWIFCTQPETRGRVRAVGEWHPHYFMESHEMWSQDTFLFMPARAPQNPNIGEHVRRWEGRFAEDQAKAFDAHAWRYYTGEWNEGWYPGYSGSWAAMRGIVDNLYEQAAIGIDAVRRKEGTLEAYREAVHKQVVASMANLESLARDRDEVVRDFAESRRKAVEGAQGEQRFFIIRPAEGNSGRMARLMDLVELQGVEAWRAGAEFRANTRDWLGREVKDASFPAGTLIVPTKQPLGSLAAALFETDPRMSPEFLTEERRELLRFGQSRLYDITGWNLAMLFGIEIAESSGPLPGGIEKVDFAAVKAPPADVPEGTVAVAYMLDGRDDRSVSAAARLMERGVRVRAIDKPTMLDGETTARGSYFITVKDNQDFEGDLAAVVREVCGLFSVGAKAVASGMGPGDAPDMGGQHFVLLERPRVAVLSREPFNPYTVGEMWHLIDHEMGIRAAFLNTSELGGMDLRRYNVLIVPDGESDGWDDALPGIKAWVEAGGTLIGIGSAAEAICDEKRGIGSTRLLPDVLTKLDNYRAAIVRDWLGKNVHVDPAQVWSNGVPTTPEYPWTLGEVEKVEEDEAKRRDAWRALFMPQGAIVAGRVDDRHWITAGCGEVLPVLVGDGPVLIPKQGGHAPVLLGAYVPAPAKADVGDPTKAEDSKGAPAEASKVADAQGKAEEKKKEKDAPGWIVAPPGFELRLRMCGLLWPEAADRLAHSAYATQEGVGKGQVILFHGSPTFRAATRGSTRLMMNAIVCGPGMGASRAIEP